MNETAMVMKTTKANRIVKNYVAASLVAALIPIPAFDLIALTGIQLKLLHRLSKLYHVPYSVNLGKSLIVSLLGGITSVRTGLFMSSATKTVPGLGTISSIAGVFVAGGASTYAIGKIFIQHFESGGTFLTFDPVAVREYFAAEFERGKQVVEELQADSSVATGQNPVDTQRPTGEQAPSPQILAEESMTTTPSPEPDALADSPGLTALAGSPGLTALAGEGSTNPLREESIVTESVAPPPVSEPQARSPEPTVTETVAEVEVTSTPPVIAEPQTGLSEPVVPVTVIEVEGTSTPPVIAKPPTCPPEPPVTETVVEVEVTSTPPVIAEPQTCPPEPVVPVTVAEVEVTATPPVATPPAKAVDIDVDATISSVKAIFGEGPKASEPVIIMLPREVEAISPPPAVATSQLDSSSDQELKAPVSSSPSETQAKTVAAVPPVGEAKPNDPPVVTVTEDNNSTKGKRRTRNYGMGRMR